MKIIIAFDKYKGCLTATELCSAGESALRLRFEPDAEILSMPMSDGGEGMQEILDGIYRGRTDAPCFIETARWCGLAQLPAYQRNPSVQSTYPLGQAIADAISSGRRDIVVGLGGSATNDAGTGMLQALGYRFIDRNGDLIERPMCGALLEEVAAIDTSHALPGLSETRFTAICDVDAPLYGPDGAACVFAPQKGASPAMVKMLDRGLRRFAAVAGDPEASSPGDGAAGGIGFGLRTFLHAEMIPGTEYIMRAYGFDRAVKDASLIITGEGRSDRQTLMGKVPMGVLKHGLDARVPVYLVSGAVDDRQALAEAGFRCIEAVTPPDIPIAQALDPDTARRNLSDALRTMPLT